MACNISQVAERGLIAEDPAFSDKITQLYQLAMIISPEPGFVSGVAEMAVAQEQEPNPDPAFLAGVVSVTLFTDIGAEISVAGVTSLAIAQEVAPRPDPAFVSGTYGSVLIVDPEKARIGQTAQRVVVQEEAAADGSVFAQIYQSSIIVYDPALYGTIISQVAHKNLHSVEPPGYEQRLTQTAQLALHVDVTGRATFTSVVNAVQLVLVQTDAPTPPPRVVPKVVEGVGVSAIDKYPAIVQSNSEQTASSELVSRKATYPEHLQSFSHVSVGSHIVASRTEYSDPISFKSLEHLSSLIQEASIKVTKSDPQLMMSNSLAGNVIHEVSIKVVKQDPTGMKSFAAMGKQVESVAVKKPYGPDYITSDSLQRSNVLLAAVTTNYQEQVQSNALTRKIVRMTAIKAMYPNVDSVISFKSMLNIVEEISKSVTFKDPQLILPMLQLSSVAIHGCFVKDTVRPSDIQSMSKVSKSFISAGKPAVYEDPVHILPDRRLCNALVEMVVKTAEYSDPIGVDTIRRDAYGRYYVESEDK